MRVLDAKELKQLSNEIEALFGMKTNVYPLPGESDLNFRLVKCEDHALSSLNTKSLSDREFVLKLSTIDKVSLDFQNQILNHLKTRGFSAPIPRVFRTLQGEEIFVISLEENEKYYGRLLSFLPGKILAQANPHSSKLMNDVGKTLAEMDQILLGFQHSGASRYLKWDLQNALWIREFVREIPDSDDRGVVEKWIEYYSSNVHPHLKNLRRSVIHNDLNDYNILVNNDLENGQQYCAGFIDFGDAVYTQTIHELAIASTYVMMNKLDPLRSAAHIIGSYHQVLPLTESELSFLFPLICMRLCVSVVTSAIQKKNEPDNKHLTVSEEPAWVLIRRLSDIHPDFALAYFRTTCDLIPLVESKKTVQWLEENQNKIGPLFKRDLTKTRIKVFDFSPSSPSVEKLMPRLNALRDPVVEELIHCGAEIGLGKYNEIRMVYQGEDYRSLTNEGEERRTLHLGVDLFLSSGEAVLAPLDGTVHSLQNNDAQFDYGPTVILQHELQDSNLVFYTLYGHLSLESLEDLRVGQVIRRGDSFAKIGTQVENGGWSPHLHFQILTHLFGRKGDFPGVALASERSLWLGLCPDPNLILKLPVTKIEDLNRSTTELVSLRSRFIGKSLRLSYQQPLKIVRGKMQYLYDQDGRQYLDAVNNVSHVGHCHPKVVQAGQNQMAVLNTNTRYLHDDLIHYAEQLTKKLPKELSVCYFVCSGSEANELALRLARTYTQRKGTIVVEGAYHGNTNSLIEVSPYKFNGPGGSGTPPFVYQVPIPDPYRGLFKKVDPAAGQKYAKFLGNAIQLAESRKDPISEFICESLFSCGGQIVPPDGYLQDCYEQVRHAGGVCIADEVQVGFGRIGTHFWGFETQKVVPDIVTLGKSIGNGHPLAAVVTKPEIADSFNNGMEYFNTFGGNPVSCAIGLSVLEVIQAEGLQEKAEQVGEYLRKKLRLLSERFEIIGDVRGLGLFIGLELVLNRSTLEPAPNQAKYVVNRMRDRGVLLSTDGPFQNVIKIKPPLPFNLGDADFLVEQLGVVLAEDLSQI